MGYTTPDEWDAHYAGGASFRSLGDAERDLFAAHAPALDGGLALDVGCGTGCIGRDRVPRSSCRITWGRSSKRLSRCGDSSCSFPPWGL